MLFENNVGVCLYLVMVFLIREGQMADSALKRRTTNSHNEGRNHYNFQLITIRYKIALQCQCCNRSFSRHLKSCHPLLLVGKCLQKAHVFSTMYYTPVLLQVQFKRRTFHVPNLIPSIVYIKRSTHQLWSSGPHRNFGCGASSF